MNTKLWVATTGVQATAAGLSARHGGSVTHTYRSTLKGFAVKLSEAAARRLAADPSVAYVEQDHVATLAGTQSPTPSWGLDRVDQRSLPLDNSYTYPNDGAGVRAYILDTGIRFSHTDFGGRAVSGRDTVDNLEVSDFDVYWTITGQMRVQAKDLPAGTPIR